MQKTKYKLIYNRKDKLNKENKALIKIEIYLDKKRKYISTGIYVKPNHWDPKSREINSNNNHYMEKTDKMTHSYGFTPLMPY